MIPKFRVWIKNCKEMIYLAESLGSDIHMQINNHSWGIFDGSDSVALANNHFSDILMQCTGLTDKNKSELYDKDIVKIWNEEFEVSPRLAVVIWDRTGQWVFDFGDDELLAAPDIFNDLSVMGIDEVCSSTSIEKVGNIFQNENLLTNGLKQGYSKHGK